VTYEEYMASPAWRHLRCQAIERDGSRCRLCNAAEDLEVHHRCYPPRQRWDLDTVEALTTLCRGCHLLITNKQRLQRYAVVPSIVLHHAKRITPSVVVTHERLPRPELQDHRRCTPSDA
jgi:hypothetical protein